MVMIWQKYEPTLDELLADSGTRALMRADRIERRDIELLFTQIAARIAKSNRYARPLASCACGAATTL